MPPRYPICRAGRAIARGALVVLALGAAMACGDSSGQDARPLVLASTTSTEDSGLFETLLPAFEASHPEYDLQVIAVGTGQALELGRRRDADVLLVHAPAAESVFIARGHGTERREVMYNDFVIVGPADDPAGVRGMGEAGAALRAIAGAGAPFVSRGDDSGTHRRERMLWQAAGLTPRGAWYREVGQGMSETLRVAAERAAYTLTDRATFLFLAGTLSLAVLVEDDDRLFNQYAVIPVRDARNADGARAFADWITAPAAQTMIGEYGVRRFGRPLFTPNAGVADDPATR